MSLKGIVTFINIACNGFKILLFKKKKHKLDGNKIHYSNDYEIYSYINILLIYLITNKIITNKFLNEKLFIYFVLLILVEQFNTSIELISDFIEPKYNSRIGDIKDLASCFSVTVIILALIHIFIFNIN